MSLEFASKGGRRVVAVDGGATKTDVIWLNARGVQMKAHTYGPLPFHLPMDKWIERLFEWARPSPSSGSWCDDPDAVVVVCIANLDRPEDGKRLRALVEQARWRAQSLLANDTFAVLRSGLPPRLSAQRFEGIGITCGTGINCVGLRPDGKSHRFLAFGETSGDWGGGNDIGMAAIWHAIRAHDGRGTPTSLADVIPGEFGVEDMPTVSWWLEDGRIAPDTVRHLTPMVFEHALAGDVVAGDILQRLASEVVSMARVALERTGLGARGTHVVLGGSVLARDHPSTTRQIREGIAAVSPHSRVCVAKVSPVWGAAMIGMDYQREPERYSPQSNDWIS